MKYTFMFERTKQNIDFPFWMIFFFIFAILYDIFIYYLPFNYFAIICIFGQKHKSHILIGFRFYFRHERHKNVKLDRRFYINALYGGCEFDAGWLLVHDIQSIQYCEYEKENHPKGKVNVLFSPLKHLVSGLFFLFSPLVSMLHCSDDLLSIWIVLLVVSPS
jgi:hypothetical protein